MPGKDTTGFNFADTSVICPVLNISLSDSSQQYIVKSENVYYPLNTYITYSNTGNTPAYNAIITLYYPTGFSVNKASIPYTTTSDSIITFTIGTIYPDSSSTIIVFDSVSQRPNDFGNYYFAAIITPNCITKDSIYNYASIVKYPHTTAITNSLNPLSGISLAPNPTNGNFMLSFQQPDIYQVTVFNSLGSEVSELSATGTSASINLGNAVPGIYYVTITSAKGSATKKLVVE